MVIPVFGRFYVGSVRGGSGYVSPLPPEHHSPIYCGSSGIWDFSRDGVMSGRTGHTEVVVTGRPIIGYHDDICEGGGDRDGDGNGYVEGEVGGYGGGG